ncbi:hypothetical protein F4778DRAFT_786695 [Xylariomycetidae sp. FL2044]|nr:hypothetical protein F4778DRAFT_786695 [Xylariomycetidae sp. FL2044]
MYDVIIAVHDVLASWARPGPSKAWPKMVADGQFSMNFQVAISWLYEWLSGGLYDTSKMERPGVPVLYDTIKVKVN